MKTPDISCVITTNTMLEDYDGLLNQCYCLMYENNNNLFTPIAISSYEHDIKRITSQRYFKEKYKDKKLFVQAPTKKKTIKPDPAPLDYIYIDEVLDKYWKLCEIDIGAMNIGAGEYSYIKILYISDEQYGLYDIIDNYKMKGNKLLIQKSPLEAEDRVSKLLKRYAYLSKQVEPISKKNFLNLINMILINGEISIYNSRTIEFTDSYSIKLLFKNFIENWEFPFNKFVQYKKAYKSKQFDFILLKHLFDIRFENNYIEMNSETRKVELYDSSKNRLT